jgi:hypothetical protein
MKSNNYKDLYYLCLPIIYIVYLIYIRILVQRLPRDIDVISPIRMYLIMFIILCLLIRLYFLLKQDNIINNKETKNIYILKIKKIFQIFAEHLTEIRTMFIRILSNAIKNYNFYVLEWIRYYYLYTPSKKITILVFSFEILPKLIVLAVFLIDVIFFKQLYFSYKFAALLLLPLIPPFITAIIQEFYTTNIEDIVDLLDSKPIEGTEYHEFCFYDPSVVPDFVGDLNSFLSLHFCPVFYVPYINAWINDIRNKYYFNKIKIVICIVYIFVWSYILMMGLGFI